MGGEEISHGLVFQPSGTAGDRTERQTPMFLHLASWFQTCRKINFMSYNRARLLHSVSPRNTRVLQLTLLLYPDSDMECLSSLPLPLATKESEHNTVLLWIATNSSSVGGFWFVKSLNTASSKYKYPKRIIYANKYKFLRKFCGKCSIDQIFYGLGKCPGVQVSGIIYGATSGKGHSNSRRD
jgi:hypothetical protein